jgi:hypothetical protein
VSKPRKRAAKTEPAPEPFAFTDPDAGLIGPGAAGSLHDIPDCLVCYAQGGGGHGQNCPNAGTDPADWVTEPPHGMSRPETAASRG